MSPELSAVVVVGPLRERAGECLRSLLDQGLGERLEVVVVDLAGGGALPVPGGEDPAVRVLESPPSTTFPQARARGLRAARGAVVAFVEEHAVAFPGWAEALLAAHRGPYAGVGPAVVNGNPGVGSSDIEGLLACSRSARLPSMPALAAWRAVCARLVARRSGKALASR
ncbi:MAG TPA: glycosyltransferase [Thermoanaerobaculia bacterium]|nr:glycosyltransferase [Thermoanaerobaculia bacterium]